jgi:undecaprenyl-diphosphatase
VNALTSADEGLYRALRVPTPLETPLRTFSKAGEHSACWLAFGAAAAAIDAPRRQQWLRATRVVGAAYLANVALKHVTRRQRPSVPGFPALISTPTQLSFPSAHACSSFAAARVYSDLLPEATIPLYIGASAMALSRVALGVHYPTDIVAGATLGTVLGELLS